MIFFSPTFSWYHLQHRCWTMKDLLIVVIVNNLQNVHSRLIVHASLFVTFMCLHAPLTILTQDTLNLNMTHICCFHRAKFSPSNFSFPITYLFLDVIILTYAFQSYYTTNMFNYIVAHLIFISGPVTKWTMARNILILTYMVWNKKKQDQF